MTLLYSFDVHINIEESIDIQEIYRQRNHKVKGTKIIRRKLPPVQSSELKLHANFTARPAVRRVAAAIVLRHYICAAKQRYKTRASEDRPSL